VSGIFYKIGVFDSGLGGLFLLKELNQQFPGKSFVYLADKMHFPYGEQQLSLVCSLVKKNVDFLISQGVGQVIIACNTASAVLDEQTVYPVPVWGVIEPSLRQAERDSVNKKVGLLATTGTVRSKAFLKKAEKLNLNLQIYQRPCPLLAPFVEQGGWNTHYRKSSKGDPNKNKEKSRTQTNVSAQSKTATFKEKEYQHKIKTRDMKKVGNDKQHKNQVENLPLLLHEYLDPLMKEGVDTVIMGCTHYLYLQSAIEQYTGKNKKVVGPVNFLIKNMKELYKKSGMLPPPAREKGHGSSSSDFRASAVKAKVSLFIHGKNGQFNGQFEEECRKILKDQVEMDIKPVWIP